MKSIYINRNLIIKIDDEDSISVSKFKWHFSLGYARTWIWSGRKKIGQYLHRYLMGLKYGDKSQIDHIDGDKSNNQKSNLRICSIGQNQCNVRRQRSNNTSGFRGVYFDKSRGSWYCQIKSEGKTKTIGTGFSNPESASKLRDCLLKRFHGEFSVLSSDLSFNIK